MKRVGLSVAALLLPLLADQAHAAHCAHGLFWRVKLNQCVAANSKLALAYEYPQRHVRPLQKPPQNITENIHDRAPVVNAEPPEIEVLRKRLTAPAHLTSDDILLSRAATLTLEKS